MRKIVLQAFAIAVVFLPAGSQAAQTCSQMQATSRAHSAWKAELGRFLADWNDQGLTPDRKYRVERMALNEIAARVREFSNVRPDAQTTGYLKDVRDIQIEIDANRMSHVAAIPHLRAGLIALQGKMDGMVSQAQLQHPECGLSPGQTCAQMQATSRAHSAWKAEFGRLLADWDDPTLTSNEKYSAERAGLNEIAARVRQFSNVAPDAETIRYLTDARDIQIEIDRNGMTHTAAVPHLRSGLIALEEKMDGMILRAQYRNPDCALGPVAAPAGGSGRTAIVDGY